MLDNIYSFSSEKMLDYLKNFDYLREKYLIDDSSLLKKLEVFEKYEQQGQLQKMPPSYIGKTVNSVYGLSYNKKINAIHNFSIVWQKIINNFLNIKGLELLFNEHYYDFEWDMHLEIDFEKSSPTYYRDHMEHQIRNMYMMMVLLDEYGFSKIIKNILLDKSNNKVSDYVKNRYNNLIEKITLSNERHKLLADCAKYYFCNQIKDFITNDKIYNESLKDNSRENIVYQLITFFENEKFIDFDYEIRESFQRFFCFQICNDGEISFYREVSFSFEKLKEWIEEISEQILVRAYIKEYTINYIVRSSAIISALFHDISYPVCFFFNVRRRVGQYLPAMNAFINNVEADIDRIVSLLQPSLLFILVSESEIRSKISKNQKKYDHGVFSAIALLLSFYESGRIHQLSIDKQIAIELAALAIYNHNFSYYIDGQDKKEYYRPIFQQNPISYLLKICDDMQEWDRKYFELSEKNSFTYCPICLSPIIEVEQYDDRNEIHKNLLCGCRNKKYTDAKFFPSRNMYIVTTCKSLEVNPSDKNQFTDLIFKFNYSLLDLLYMSQISTSYSVYRAKELGKLKKLLLNQKFYDSEHNKEIGNIYLDYTMSNNPIFLKSKIILSYILKVVNFNINSFNNNINRIEINVLNYIHKYVNELDSILSSIDFTGYSENDFYEVFKSETLKLLNNKILKPYKSKQKLLFSFWIYSLFNEFKSQNYRILWDLFYKKFVSTYSSSDSKEFLNLVRISKWDDFTTSINNILKESCSAVLVKHVLTSAVSKSLLTEKQKDYRSCFIKLLENKTCFYLELAGYIMKSMFNTSLLPQESVFIDYMLSLKFAPCDDKRSDFFDLIKEMLKDMYKIIYNQVDVFDSFDVNRYKVQYMPQKKISHIVEKYCNSINWYENNSESYTKFIFNNLDYHSDLIIFEILGKKLNEI